MSVPLRLAAFAVGLLAAFGAAFGVGRAVGPITEGPSGRPSATTTVPMDHGSHP